MILHRDHVVGGALFAAAVFLWAISGDLPFGTLGSPGAGMLPTLLISLLGIFGAIIFFDADESPPLGAIDWSDLGHAAAVLAVAAFAALAYTRLGFLITIPAMLFVLVFALERKPLPVALSFSIGAAALAYAVFGVALKAGLPTGPWGF